MRITDLIPTLLRRGPEPEAPADTMPVILERLNGSAGDPVQVSLAIEQLFSANASWIRFQSDAEQQLRQLTAEGADEKKRRPIRDAISRAGEEIKLFRDSVAPLKQRLVKARADVVHARKYHGQEMLAAELKPIIEALLPLIDRAAPIIARINRGEINCDTRFIQSVLPGLAWVTRYVVENRSHFEIALDAIARQYVAPQPDAAPLVPRKLKWLSPRKAQTEDGQIIELSAINFRSPPQKNAKPAEPYGGMQHAVSATEMPLTVMSLPAAATPTPRKPDDLSPLGPGEMRVKVIRGGYEHPTSGQCIAGQVVKLPVHIAQKAIGNSAVVAVEMNVDRTKVEGGSWEGTDPASLVKIGSGGTTITQQPETKPTAGGNDQPDEGVVEK